MIPVFCTALSIWIFKFNKTVVDSMIFTLKASNYDETGMYAL